ncbi:hypothetical protein SeMB42_g06995 [Synchytrium endobioticum]|uniref:Integrase catalytic domain-containing protein n=1 Tax=Synchytrium endobioticum TaxID=286115 RepID=A0A507C749_9FUNG|nr:hypothetical protein SeMB42_g06995 [Synchytrium endobioticum]TPX39547.1 hypothetical protein SeLEV6574_g07127 [Synchytrium endobioticum]
MELFWDKVVCRHGVLQSIISDPGPQFRSKFWKAFLARLGSNSALSSAYHPETDGQSERLNQEIEAYLRCFSSFEQDNWVALLPQAEFVHNNSFHSRIGMSPFCAWTGQDAEIGLLGQKSSPAGVEVPFADQLKNRYKSNADEGRREEPLFQKGDEVMVSTHNIRTDRPSKKLEYRWIGPYYIRRQINPVTYEVELPHNLKIHNVFQVSLLKRYYRPKDPSRQLPKPPPIRIVEGEEYEIKEIIDVRRRGKGFEYKIWWEGWSEGEAS